jgi:hypothetical protein
MVPAGGDDVHPRYRGTEHLPYPEFAGNVHRFRVGPPLFPGIEQGVHRPPLVIPKPGNVHRLEPHRAVGVPVVGLNRHADDPCLGAARAGHGVQVVHVRRCREIAPGVSKKGGFLEESHEVRHQPVPIPSTSFPPAVEGEVARGQGVDRDEKDRRRLARGAGAGRPVLAAATDDPLREAERKARTCRTLEERPPRKLSGHVLYPSNPSTSPLPAASSGRTRASCRTAPTLSDFR